MGFDQPVHWVVVVVLAALLFGGYKKLPEMARSAGRSMRIFKTELKGMADDDEARDAAKNDAGASVAQPVQPAVAVAVTPTQPVTQSFPQPAAAPVATPVTTPGAARLTDPTAPPTP